MFCQSLNCVSSLCRPCSSDTSFGKSKELVIVVDVFNASLALVLLSGPYTGISRACSETLSVHVAESAEAEADPYATPSHAENSALLKCAQKQTLMAKEKNVQTFCDSFHRLIKSLHKITRGKKVMIFLGMPGTKGLNLSPNLP